MISPKLALRSLFKSPFVTTVAVASLALGIGANAAIFSLFEQLLLRPLPVQDPGALVNLGAPGPNPGSQSCNSAGDCDVVFSYLMFRDLEKGQKVFQGIAAHRLFGANLALTGQTPVSGDAVLVSGSYFRVLGLRPALGRLLTESDDQTIGAHFVAVLSHDYWTARLGSDPGVLNRQIEVNGHSFKIVGVAPQGFNGTTLGSLPKLFVPISMRAEVIPGFTGFESRTNYWVYLFARLKPGTSLEQAAVGINGVYTPIIQAVEAPLQEGMSDKTMVRFKAKTITLEKGARGQSSLHTEARTPLIMLFSLTGLVLLIACANIANLLLARGAGRTMEMAVRLSLGAGRRQLLGQLLLESCLLSLLGGAAGLLVARWTLGAIGSILPTDSATSLNLELQLPVVFFTAALALATGLLFGMFPALHSTRPDLMGTVRANTGQLTGAKRAARFRSTLVVAQIALSMALLASAGLFIKSLRNVSRVDLGLNPDHVLMFVISPALNGYSNARSAILFRRVQEELAGLPGVTSVTSAMVAVLSGNSWGSDVSVEGFKKEADTDANSRFNQVGPGYFKTLGMPILAGREFTEADAPGAPKVAIVNEAFARKFGLTGAVVGKRMTNDGNDLTVEIVGLVKDAKYNDVKREVPPLFFFSAAQDTTLGYSYFYLKTTLEPDQMMKSVTAVIARLDPNLPIESLKTLPNQIKENVFLDRMISLLSASFAVLATLLAAVGLYGVLAYTVAQRTREIGVRMALGADAGQVRGMVLRQVGWMTLVGTGIGVAAALLLGRTAQSLLYGLQSTDPVVLVLSAVVLAAVALGAGFLPARRASRVHPMQALRYE